MVINSVACSDREDVEQFAPGARVEVRRRLVEREQLRAHREHRGDRHAATLAHRELVRSAVGGVLHAHRPQRFRDARLDERGIEPEVHGTERDVLGDGRHEELVVGILEDQADTAA